jgi:transposase-like protein
MQGRNEADGQQGRIVRRAEEGAGRVHFERRTRRSSWRRAGGWQAQDRKALAGALKTSYRAKDADAANVALAAFDASHSGQKYHAITQSWRRNWARMIPFVRRIIYTTNAIESLNAKPPAIEITPAADMAALVGSAAFTP